MADLRRSNDPIFESASSIAIFLDLDPSVATIHVDIHEVAGVVHRFSFIEGRAQVRITLKPAKKGVPLDSFEPYVTQRRYHKTVRVVVDPARGRSDAHFFVVEEELVWDRQVPWVNLLLEEVGEGLDSALIEVCAVLELELFFNDAVGEPNNLLVGDDASIGKQSPILREVENPVSEEVLV